MATTVYIETSVVSYFTARPSRDLIIAAYQETTHELWPMLSSGFSTYISALVYDESAKGDPEQARQRLVALKPFPMLDINDEARKLANVMLRGKAVPERFPEDALHIAVCAVNSVHVLLTWNFAHLSNPFSRRTIREIVAREGYVCPEICSPTELLETVR